MPVYEYECSACGHRFEEWQKITDKPVKVCPKCKARKVERLISQTSFQLKGGGWYGDLYSSTKGGAKTSSGSSSSESKPAASSDSPSKSTGSKKSKPAA
jgi:putative FmdB family regulatory protein